jgi:hypothetical protein
MRYGKTPIRNAAMARSRSKSAQLDRQIIQARALMRKMRETIEDIEDAQTIERAKKANGKKPRMPWTEVKKELGLD